MCLKKKLNICLIYNYQKITMQKMKVNRCLTLYKCLNIFSTGIKWEIKKLRLLKNYMTEEHVSNKIIIIKYILYNV